jgi:hypothetical protein
VAGGEAAVLMSLGDGLVDAAGWVVGVGWAFCTPHAANRRAVVAELAPATIRVLRIERTRPSRHEGF